MNILNSIDLFVGRFIKLFSILCLAFLFLLLSLNVLIRFFPVFSIGWFDELVEMCFGYMVFIGAAGILRNKEHFRIEWLDDKLGDTRARKYLFLFVYLINIIFFGVFLYYSFELIIRAQGHTPVFRIPRRYVYLSMPISALIMFVYSIRDTVVQILDIKQSHSK